MTNIRIITTLLLTASLYQCSYANPSSGTVEETSALQSDFADWAGVSTLLLPNDTTISDFWATVLDDADAGTARSTLGLSIGSDVQAYSATLAGTEESFTSALLSKLDGIEASADVTDTSNVTAAGALMDSELTSLSGVKSLTVPDSTTITSFAATLLDDADQATAQATLGLDAKADTVDTIVADPAIPFVFGGVSSLDSIPTTTLAAGRIQCVNTVSGVYVYELQNSSAPEFFPWVIRPDDFDASSNAKAWFLAELELFRATAGEIDVQNINNAATTTIRSDNLTASRDLDTPNADGTIALTSRADGSLGPSELGIPSYADEAAGNAAESANAVYFNEATNKYQIGTDVAEHVFQRRELTTDTTVTNDFHGDDVKLTTATLTFPSTAVAPMRFTLHAEGDCTLSFSEDYLFVGDNAANGTTSGDFGQIATPPLVAQSYYVCQVIDGTWVIHRLANYDN